MTASSTRRKAGTVPAQSPAASDFAGERTAAELQRRVDELEASASVAVLPRIGDAFHGGHFGGVLSDDNGVPYAVVLLPHALNVGVDWWAAMSWAHEVGGDLPTCGEVHMLLKNLYRGQWSHGFTWTADDYFRSPATQAWGFNGLGARTAAENKSDLGNAFAVRRIPLELGLTVTVNASSEPGRVKLPRLPAATLASSAAGSSESVGLSGSITAADLIALKSVVLFMETFVQGIDASDADSQTAVNKARAHLDAARVAMANLTKVYRNECSSRMAA